MGTKFPLISDQNIIFVCGASRTGTTLACALLDTHPEIKMLNEFIFPLQIKLDQFDDWLSAVNLGEPPIEGNSLTAQESKKLTAFIRRTGMTVEQLSAFLKNKELEKLNGEINDFKSRLFFSSVLARVVLSVNNKHQTIGFKLNNSQIFSASEMFPQARFLIITRDPSTTVDSQLVNTMSADVNIAEKVLQNYYGEYKKFSAKYQERSDVVSLELLSRAPGRGIRSFLQKCTPLKSTKISINELAYCEVIKRGHKNSSSISAGIRTVDMKNLVNFSLMPKTVKAMGLGNSLKYSFKNIKYGKSFQKKRKLIKSQYLEVITRLTKDHSVLTLRDLNRHCIGKNKDTKIGFVRHDIDHDIDNAVLLAELDASLGIKATYCVLHTAPYYGQFVKEKMCYQLTDSCIDSIRYIQSLGHEINFHNNLIVKALQDGINPYAILENELQQWWDIGVAISGTSTHGDKLCKEFQFRNWELFEECDLKSDGRNYLKIDIETKDRRSQTLVAKRCVPMREFALEYEAYEFPKTLYITDSGGNLRQHENVRGHSSKKKVFESYDVFGVLTHPIWWDLS